MNGCFGSLADYKSTPSSATPGAGVGGEAAVQKLLRLARDDESLQKQDREVVADAAREHE